VRALEKNQGFSSAVNPHKAEEEKKGVGDDGCPKCQHASKHRGGRPLTGGGNSKQSKVILRAGTRRRGKALHCSARDLYYGTNGGKKTTPEPQSIKKGGDQVH